MHETFLVGAFVCLIALGFAFLMQNPAPRRVESEDRVPIAHPAAAD
jgi:hypothetical protein